MPIHTRCLRSAAILFVLLLAHAPASARVPDVPLDCASIQEAIDAAEAGDIVLVYPGTYLETDISFRGKGVTVMGKSPSDPAAVSSTVVDAGRQGGVFVFSDRENASSVLTGSPSPDPRASRAPGSNAWNRPHHQPLRDSGQPKHILECRRLRIGLP